MSSRIKKQFSNAATTPILITMSFELNDDKIIERIDAAGGTVPQNDIAKAEQQRMVRWVRDAFIGQHEFFLNSHNGKVPAPSFAESPSAPEIHVVNTIEAPGVSTPEFAKRLAEHIMRKNPELNPEPEPEVGHQNYADAPRVGTYWRDLERSQRFFFVQSTHECEGHSHVRMLRVDNQRGGVYDFPFSDGVQWGKMFERVTGKDVPGNPYAAAGSVVYAREGDIEVSFGGNAAINARDLTDQQIDRIVVEHGEQYPGLREFLVDARKPERKVGMPPELGMPYGEAKRVPFDELEIRWHAIPTEEAERLVEQYRNAHPEVSQLFRQFLDNVPFEGSEQPPQPGERYYSYISDQTYTVVDVRRKLHDTDLYVTMERNIDKQRAKFTYRDHAHWLAVWRPLDHEDKPRKTVEIELKVDAADAMRQVGEAAHAAAEAAMDFRETDAERQLNVIYRELDKHVPGWRNRGFHHERVDDAGLALRAIRSLNKHMRNYQRIAETSTNEVAKLSDKNRELSSLLGARTREVDKLKQERGGAWDAARVRREQDTMRELLRHYALLFVRHHGRATPKRLLAELDTETLLGLPHEHFMLLVTRCEAHSDRQGG